MVRIYLNVSFSPVYPAILFFIFFSCLSCHKETPWKLDSIATGNQTFDSSRLCYQDSLSPLQLELIYSNQQTFCFLNLHRFRFHDHTVKAQLKIGDQIFEESLPVGEGKMRLRLPDSFAKQLISSLQEGKEVSILVDGFEETFLPENFQKMYEKWKGGSTSFTFKGPME